MGSEFQRRGEKLLTSPSPLRVLPSSTESENGTGHRRLSPHAVSTHQMNEKLVDDHSFISTQRFLILTIAGILVFHGMPYGLFPPDSKQFRGWFLGKPFDRTQVYEDLAN